MSESFIWCWFNVFLLWKVNIDATACLSFMDQLIKHVLKMINTMFLTKTEQVTKEICAPKKRPFV